MQTLTDLRGKGGVGKEEVELMESVVGVILHSNQSLEKRDVMRRGWGEAGGKADMSFRASPANSTPHPQAEAQV